MMTMRMTNVLMISLILLPRNTRMNPAGWGSTKRKRFRTLKLRNMWFMLIIQSTQAVLLFLLCW